MDEIDEALIDACAQCGTNSTSAAVMAANELEFQVNMTCGHKFCKNCLNDIFTNQGKRQFSCASCTKLGKQVMVKREKLSKKSLDSLEVDKDIRIRRKIKLIFNQTPKDFETLEAFNNYEEEVEDIIFNLVNDQNKDAMMEKIEAYRQKNEVSIALNEGRAFEEDSRLERQVQQEKEALELKLQAQQLSEQKERTFKAERHRQLNELALGERESLTVSRDNPSGGVDTTAPGGTTSEDTLKMQQQALQQFSSHSALLRGIEQRPAPKLLSTVKNKTEKRRYERSLSKQEKLRMHAAGGYSHSTWLKKSYCEGLPEASVPVKLF